jgi:hypothetical protein
MTIVTPWDRPPGRSGPAKAGCGQDCLMPHSFRNHHAPAWIVGQSPWTAADAPVGPLAFCRMAVSLFRPRDEGVPRRPGGLPHKILQHSRYWENYVAAGKIAQCHLVFAKLGIRHNWRADPLVRAGRPRPAFLSKNPSLATIDKSARGPAANEGGCPTIYAGGGIGKTKRHWARLPAPLRRHRVCGATPA